MTELVVWILPCFCVQIGYGFVYLPVPRPTYFGGGVVEEEPSSLEERPFPFPYLTT